MFSKHIDIISVSLGLALASITGTLTVVQEQAVVIEGALQGIAGLVGLFIGGLPERFRKSLGE
jgi:hypothetical protein